MKQIIIDRARWGKAWLRRIDNGKQCCLGFACEAYGITVDEITCVLLPCNLALPLQEKLPKWLVSDADHSDNEKASIINDDPKISWSKKEKLLKAIFKKHRINLVFKGKRQ
jgi:hypothetical protein